VTAGPATTGPATTGPATTGPATTGPATTGPATVSAVTARASIRVEATAAGARVAALRSQVPLVLRDTTPRHPAGVGGPPTVEVHLVNAAAGPLAGDRLRLDVAVGPGVRLVLRSAAATVALPGRGRGRSVFEIHADVGHAGILEVLLEPTVAAGGCHHRSVGTARLAAAARLVWREEVLLGRFGEEAGSIETCLRVDVATGPGAEPEHGAARGRGEARTAPLLRQELRLGPEVPGVAGPAVLDGARAIGSLLVARAGAPAGLGAVPVSRDRSALLPLAGPGVLISALADDAVTLRRSLTELAELIGANPAG
jgi:urease accessory protein